jgi:gamma-glutamylcyclotransferase (GGCT)/AIG2-like uncharacterized protein YtfP
MSSFPNTKSIRLQSANILLDNAYMFGYLFEINGYPGAVPDPTTGSKVYGELYQLSDPEITFRWMDRYEEATPDFRTDPEYQRIIVPVYTRNQKHEAWVYRYNKNTDGLRRIHSGNYLKFIR